MSDLPLLSIVIFLPIAGIPVILGLKSDAAIKWATLAILTADFLLATSLVFAFDASTATMQFAESVVWIRALGISYAVGVDGISVLFVFLTSLLGWICVVASWTAIDTKIKTFMINLLVMQTFMLGVFCALDLFLFYVFWEAMLIPMYVIIGVWGGDNRVYAAFKFFLYTLAGSLLFLVGVVVLYFEGGRSFDILVLMERDFPFHIQAWVFLAFFVAFAVKVPMVPVHTWLPDAHVQAPTAGSIILAGVLLKMGAYGFLRFSLPMLPDAAQYFAPFVIALSAVAIVYGGFLALAQEDLKKLIAYSSVSHMGFVTLGLFTFKSNGLNGAVLQMFNHGITTGALFLFVGLIYERTHTRQIAEYGGLMKVVPVYTLFLGLFSLASMAVPGTNGFVGELLVLSGAFATGKATGAIAIVGAMLSAAYMLRLIRRVGLGPLIHDKTRSLWEINGREMSAALPLAIFVIWVGFYPAPFLDILGPSLDHLLGQVLGP
ncbi:NADH-quinone oxidoreductase subunit M [Pelagibius sp. Alg239-R121]|uniref:NADH-quinone oxidoreductase subunit M n=1 Tax=Pelagibius sp. Alg239-R121 TaxID=2993448 RepID=UPI0024A6F65C|nr:NADH-quinone oxidoreductase subunit M [Pelagibius sp. Alg239-R121]